MFKNDTVTFPQYVQFLNQCLQFFVQLHSTSLYFPYKNFFGIFGGYPVKISLPSHTSENQIIKTLLFIASLYCYVPHDYNSGSNKKERKYESLDTILYTQLVSIESRLSQELTEHVCTARSNENRTLTK